MYDASDMDGDVPSTPRQLLENLLGQGMVMVTIDARAEGAVVPNQFDRDPQLRLNLSYRFGLPIEVDDWGVKARLTFSGIPFDCELPWSSIYMIVSHVTGQPFLFPEHVPQELMQLATQMRSHEGTAEADSAPKKPRLKIVSSEDEEAAADRALNEAVAAVRDRVDGTPIGDAGNESTVPPEAAPPAAPVTEEPARETPDPPRTPPRRGHLRVVK